MRFAKTLLPCLCLVIALFAFGVPGKTLPRTNDEPQPANDKAETAHYPDFGFLPQRRQYVGRVFRLSQTYPKDLAATATIPEICTRNIDEVKKNWKQYLLDVRAYCFEENVGHADVADDWRVENNPTRRWYHMPWQHYGDKGREGIHGMTKEAPVQPRQLARTQTHSARTPDARTMNRWVRGGNVKFVDRQS